MLRTLAYAGSWIVVLGLTACGPAVDGGESPQGTSTTQGDGSVDTTPPPPLTTTETPPTVSGTSPMVTTGADESSSGVSTGFFPDWGLDGPCSTYQQDCPPQEKCNPLSHNGDPGWTTADCFPVVRDPDQTGEACTAPEGPFSGVDTCDRGDMCWDVDPVRGEGVCVRHCMGTEADPICPEGSACSTNGDGFLALCIPTCDPLDAGAVCDDDEGCYPLDDNFACVPDASEGAGLPGDPCGFVNSCTTGHACLPPVKPLCTEEGAGMGCCIPFCDLNTPDCPEDLDCIPWYEADEAPADLAHVGICGEP